MWAEWIYDNPDTTPTATAIPAGRGGTSIPTAPIRCMPFTGATACPISAGQRRRRPETARHSRHGKTHHPLEWTGVGEFLDVFSG